jgi:hypothetical protein
MWPADWVRSLGQFEGDGLPQGSIFLQMPVILARGFVNISLYSVSNYMTMIMHDGTSRVSISLAERSVGRGIKSLSNAL